MKHIQKPWQERISAADGLSLDLAGTDVDSIPAGTSVQFRLDLSNCLVLSELPERLEAGSLVLSGCKNLKTLPERMNVSFLDISDCPQLSDWPTEGKIEAGRLRARNCVVLTSLPRWVRSISQLDLRGCSNISELPNWLRVSSWIDLAGTGIRELPENLMDCALRWKGIPINHRIAFHPEDICGREILEVSNAELRRVMLERVGFERFLQDVDAETLDRDTDPGGERRLLRVEMPSDEPLVCVSVFCPSTMRQYIIRVPPTITSCHQAIAWTAGFDDASLYQPLIET